MDGKFSKIKYDIPEDIMLNMEINQMGYLKKMVNQAMKYMIKMEKNQIIIIKKFYQKFLVLMFLIKMEINQMESIQKMIQDKVKKSMIKMEINQMTNIRK